MMGPIITHPRCHATCRRCVDREDGGKTCMAYGGTILPGRMYDRTDCDLWGSRP